MNRATVKRLERLLTPPEDGTIRKLVSCLETTEGYVCHECGAIHATTAEVEAAHGGPGVGIIVERVVDQNRDPISRRAPGQNTQPK